MKKTSIFLLLAIVGLGYGCSKDNSTPPPVVVPVGTFSGTFTSLHLKSATSKIDTVTADITLTTTSNGLFKISGDTSVVHAGSHGYFNLNPVYIQFTDSTATAVAHPPKIHLNGVYQYAYTGSAFQIAAGNDTISYFYDLKKN